MRVRISHRTTYTYAEPARSVIQVLRLTPRSNDSQRVSDWRIDVEADCRLAAGEDAFGNVTHTFSLSGPVTSLAITVEGVAETIDAAGVVHGAIERFPPEFYLRETALTAADDAMRAFAAQTGAGHATPLEKLHALMGALHARMVFDADPTNSGTTASESFTLGAGVCQDFAHILIGCARHLGIPARFAGGHLLRDDGVVNQQAGHAWAEAYVEGLGWVGFDAANDICPQERHIRVAIGLDYLGAAPVRGSRNGGGAEKLDVEVRVSHAGSRSQSQSQS